MRVSTNTIERQTGPEPSATVIWLHGLGADGNDFVPLVDELQLPPGAALRFVFPQAPSIPVTGNNGYVMPAWYDIYTFSAIGRRVDETGIINSRETVRQLIAAEIARGVAAERIVVGGFSQGAAMAYVSGLTHPDRLAGIVALSGYIPAPQLVANEGSPANADVPLFIGHGGADNVVPLALGEQARSLMDNGQRDVAWRVYPIAHTVSPEEIADLRKWFMAVLFDR
ncbi:alpha/beta hydrolase [Chitinasiproducens palmae]|uniref:Phospholipase/carboxylesterase n=1 Tax=Chitinasiproducens palmae TaxID=1770053 RepID=A0A1H2PIL8_9BURK|nr:dienelactone hydrolase family protein [Chitinasiproducens palmae]SDV46092.1 phospholipase/carboxylesterase [Chitinasiproducens palmae]